MKPFYSPVLNALVSHARRSPVSFHVPGHSYGGAMELQLPVSAPDIQPADWFKSIMKLDVTELSVTDDLHHPEASIREAQQLAARTFGADETYFLVGGSTSGNIALLLTLCGPADLVILQRNVHKSIINGLKLAGATAVFLTPQTEPLSELSTVPALEQLEEALKKYPDAKAVVLSNPNYYGMGVCLKAYAKMAHRYNKPLIVDEAHGAHYGFHPLLPQSALAAGADAVVQSAHKTLPTLTMGAMLHVQGGRIDRAALREHLAMIQSSSPSFPLIASIDISRAMIDSLGSGMFEQALAAAAALRTWLNLRSCSIQEAEISDEYLENGHVYRDPLRLIIFDRSRKLSGFDLQLRLEEYGCFTEMADPRYVVLLFGIGAAMEDCHRLQEAIEGIVKECGIEDVLMHKQDAAPAPVDRKHVAPELSEPVPFTRERFKNVPTERVELRHSEHRISAEMVTPYPPGISVLYPGEMISREAIDKITRLSAAGAKFQGSADSAMETIAVYCV
ncbi:aminotransferase class I/II-fold pyridoxal phosphate-dependent enzyme [Paenibacillus sp. N4]|uniref:aminotransferase class I/II-fold pyridoxal phosphate-dependent enzyme n=1 Tax=Paenibacillus vietnamensis TaxID=2590547 RepID=UPI001CD0E44E|nr:aminotransferase class I/II-fold pyridoxal phosphate-dependent enzyme [Paenibacillus vietnamensis]MCA0758301.1 aminotransferase class I/II-fold pyridoxal phosphate-dependent enzyme [Paenibacillus vietnamensis]